jgi:hypothetical protein
MFHISLTGLVACSAAGPFYFILQEDFTIAAKLIGFAIHIPLVTAIMHNAGVILAVLQLKGVS